MNTSELFRRLENIIRFGVVQSIDYTQATCIVDFQGILTCPLRWLTVRAGSDSTWDAPSVGEQVMVLSPSGEIANGIVLFGLYSDAHPSPSQEQNIKIRKFEDGAVISYDTANHQLQAVLPGGATTILTSDGGITITGDTVINGNVQINGNTAMTGNNTVGGSQSVSGTSLAKGSLTCNGDVTASGISLTGHIHGGVKAGGDSSGGPQ